MSSEIMEASDVMTPREKRYQNRERLKAVATQRHTKSQNPVETEEPQQTSQGNQPRQTEESNVSLAEMMESVEQFCLNLATNHFALAKERAKAEIKELEDKEKATRKEHDERIKMFQAQMGPENSGDDIKESRRRKLDEYDSFDNAINELNEEQRKRQKTSETTIKTLEDKNQQVQSYLKVLKDELKQIRIKEELRREWLQAKPLDYFMSKIKDPESLLSEIEQFRNSTKSLFDFEATPEEFKRILKRLSDYTHEYDHHSILDVCSVSLQLPLLTVNNVSANSNYVPLSGSISKICKDIEIVFIPEEVGDNAEINTAFESPDIEVLDIISSLLSKMPQPEKNMNELESSLMTYHIIIHLAKLLRITKRTPIKVKPQAPVKSGYRTNDTISDFSMFIRKVVGVGEDVNFLVVDSKQFPFITEDMWTNSDLLKQEINGKLNMAFKQLTIALVEAKCARGVLCDWKKAILVEIDLKELAKIMKKKESESTKIPINFRVIDIYDTRPSYLQVLFAFLGKAFDKEKEDERMFDSLDLKSYLESPSSSNLGILHQSYRYQVSNQPTENNHVTQLAITYYQSKTIRAKPDSFQIFSTKAENLGSVITEDIDPNDEIVMKVFSTDAWSDRWRDSRKEYVDRCYQSERELVGKLMENPEFNNCFIRHQEVDVTILDIIDFKKCRGKCILSRKINRNSFEKELFNKVDKQLEDLHKNGIYLSRFLQPNSYFF